MKKPCKEHHLTIRPRKGPACAGSDFPNVAVEDIAAALPVLQRAGVPYYVHAELPDHLSLPSKVLGPAFSWACFLTSRVAADMTLWTDKLANGQAGARAYASWLASRPDHFELAAHNQLFRLLGKLDAQASAPGFRLHMAHVSSAQTLPALAAAKQQGAGRCCILR